MNQNPDDLKTAGLHRGPNHVDYRETADLTNVHAAVQREHNVGTPGAVPMPLWLMTLCGVAIFWAGTSFSGGFGASFFSADTYSQHGGDVAAGVGGGGAGGSGGGGGETSVVDLGKSYFTANCQVCHQATGMGLPNAYPPLAGSEYVNGGSRDLGMILLKGLQGPVTVEGHVFNGAMPAWEKTLTDKKIAAILTYIRQDWGNKGGPIAPEQIAEARKEFAAKTDSWSEADIKANAGKELPGGAAPAAAPAASAAAPAAGGAK